MSLNEEKVLTIYPPEGGDDTDWIEVKLHGNGDLVTVRVPVRHPELQEAVGGCAVAKLHRCDVDDLAARILGHDDYYRACMLNSMVGWELQYMSTYLADLEMLLDPVLERADHRTVESIYSQIKCIAERLERIREVIK